jgi:hypothetical protein
MWNPSPTCFYLYSTPTPPETPSNALINSANVYIYCRLPKLFSKYWKLDNVAKIRLDKVAKICTGRGMKISQAKK